MNLRNGMIFEMRASDMRMPKGRLRTMVMMKMEKKEMEKKSPHRKKL